jgi:chitinase
MRMRSFLKPMAGVICLLALAAAGCSTESEVVTSYAPYVSATEASDNDSAGSPSVYNLAFAEEGRG